MNPLDTLAGVVRLRPGQARPRSVENRRPDWAETLVRGRPAPEVPGLLASVFSLCGHAHRLCSEMALRAASGRSVLRVPGAERGLQCETLCEHVRRIGLDWPARLAPPASRDALAAEALQSLRSCPALLGANLRMPDTRLWLERQLLGMPASAWLAGWEREPDWWTEWSTSGDGWLPRLVWQARSVANWPAAAADPLHVHAGTSSLRLLAGCLREDPGYTRQPRWQGDCAETGTWTRLHDAARPPPPTPWYRLGARLAELVRLTLPDVQGRSGSGWLAFGSLAITEGEGLAWVEMARGLLLHHVRLDCAGPEHKVATYRVLAPTEWNFHADGAVAAALEGLHPARGEETQRRIVALMAAYDPCVRFEVEPQFQAQESVHA